ncbi:MAG TPA: hypothetical protein VGI05_18390 [Streptosporangiaceae bacterium]
MQRPAWWKFPEACAYGHEWGPGRVIVSWMLCDCPPALASSSRSFGHLVVSCQEPGCRSRWYKPRHEPAT